MLLWLINSRVGRAVGAVLALVGAAFVAYRKIRSDARDEIEAENNKRRLEAVKKKQEDQKDVSEIDDTSLADRISRRR